MSPNHSTKSTEEFLEKLKRDKIISTLSKNFFSWEGLLCNWDETEQELIDNGEDRDMVSLARQRAQDGLDRLREHNKFASRALSDRYRTNPRMGYSSIIEDNFF